MRCRGGLNPQLGVRPNSAMGLLLAALDREQQPKGATDLGRHVRTARMSQTAKCCGLFGRKSEVKGQGWLLLLGSDSFRPLPGGLVSELDGYSYGRPPGLFGVRCTISSA